jgi:uncharacterized protein YigA (DUF484 family)
MNELQGKLDSVLRLHEAEIELHEHRIKDLEQTIQRLQAVADKLAEALNRVKPWVISYIDNNQAAGPLQDLEAALAEYAEMKSDKLASSGDLPTDTGASQGGRE